MLKRIVIALLLIGVHGISAVKAEQVEVTYLSGTVKAIPAQTAGKLDTTIPTALELEASTSHVTIPYAAINAYDYREENRFRLGVLPAIAVGTLKARSKRHLLTIAWKDDAGVAQTATFEMTKDRAQGLVKVLDARAPQACTGGLPWRPKH
jgi:hypothetical protein